MNDKMEVSKEVLDALTTKATEVATAEAAKAIEEQNKEFIAKLTAIEENLAKQIKESASKEFSGGLKKKMFMRACSVLVLNKQDRSAIVDYNQKALELREKAGYNNTGLDADGGYIVMEPEFEAAIEKLTPDYGVALQEANVRLTDKATFKTNKRGNNVIMYEITAEGQNKTASKVSFAQVEVTLREFAGIALSSDKLIDDSAIDFWQEVIEGFAEEEARWADILVFTDTTANKQGILHYPGTKVISVGANITSLTWDHLLDAEVSVPTKAFKNGKHYMHRTIWNILRKVKGSDGHYLWMPQMGLQTPWGTPVVLVDAMPSITDVPDANEGYVVFGDLKRIRLYRKRGLEFYQSRDAIVTDSENVEHNLFVQDMTALRATVRMSSMIKFPEAFCVIGTGTVS